MQSGIPFLLLFCHLNKISVNTQPSTVRCASTMYWYLKAVSGSLKPTRLNQSKHHTHKILSASSKKKKSIVKNAVLYLWMLEISVNL